MTEIPSRLLLKGGFRGLPHPEDALGEVQILMKDDVFWLRLVKVQILNAAGVDEVSIWLCKEPAPRKLPHMDKVCVRVPLPGVPDGFVAESMPSEVQVAIDTVKDASGNPIDFRQFQSLVAATQTRVVAGRVIDAVVYAVCPLERAPLEDLSKNLRSEERVKRAAAAIAATRSAATEHPDTIRGKSFAELHTVAVNAMAALGKNARAQGSINFEEFKVVLEGLGVPFNEARAFVWFIQGDLDGSGRLEVEELQFVLSVIQHTKPRALVHPRDLFFMFDTEPKPVKERMRLGHIDVVAFIEILRAYGLKTTQARAETLFDRADEKRTFRMDYHGFLEAWLQEVDPEAELMTRSVHPRTIKASGRGLRDGLRDVLTTEEAELEAELKIAVKATLEQKSSLRLGKAKTLKARTHAVAREERRERRAAALAERAARIARRKEDEATAVDLEREAKLREEIQAADEARRKEAQQASVNAFREREERLKRDRERKGLDRLILRDRGLEFLPAELWSDPAAKELLPHVTLVDFSCNAIERLPEGRLFFELNAALKLDMHNNRLTSPLPSDVCFMRQLRILDLSSNALTALPAAIGNLDALQRLDVSSNQLGRVPASIVLLTALRTLNLESNEIAALPEELGGTVEGGDRRPAMAPLSSSLSLMLLPDDAVPSSPGPVGLVSLTDLNLGHNRLEYLPNSLGRCTALCRLDVGWNTLKELPTGLGALKRLKVLRAVQNEIRYLPEDLGQCAALEVLALADNRIRRLPAEIGGLVALTLVDLARNRLVGLPDSIGGLTSVVSLDLQRNDLRALPRTLGKLLDLQTLDLSYNQLRLLPPDLAGMQGLRRLNLSHNRLGDLDSDSDTEESTFSGTRRPKDRARAAKTAVALHGRPGRKSRIDAIPSSLSSMRALEWLDVSHNAMGDFPAAFAGFNNLCFLDFRHNELVELPDSVRSLGGLHELLLAHNFITTIHDHVGLLRQLHTLDLANNELRTLPDVLGSLPKLEHLDLSSNHLNALPLALVAIFPTLKTFNIASNPFRALPDKWGARDVLAGDALGLRFADALPASASILKDIHHRVRIDRRRRARADEDAERDRVGKERERMEMEDTRMAEHAADGRFPELVRWEKRRKPFLVLGDEAETRKRHPASDLAVEAERGADEAHGSIAAWFRRQLEGSLVFDAAASGAIEHSLARIKAPAKSEAAPGRKARRASLVGADEALREYLESTEPADAASSRPPTAPREDVNPGRPGKVIPVRLAAEDSLAVDRHHLAAPAQWHSMMSFGDGIRSGGTSLLAELGGLEERERMGRSAHRPPALARVPPGDKDDALPRRDGPSDSTASIGGGVRLPSLPSTTGAEDDGASFRVARGTPRRSPDTRWPGRRGSEDPMLTNAREVAHADLNARFDPRRRFNNTDFRHGYSIGEVADFYALQAAFFADAAAEWAVTGGDHMDGRLSVDSFLQGVRRRAGARWDPQLLPLVFRFYSEARRTGVPPEYSSMTEDEEAGRAVLVDAGRDFHAWRQERIVERIRELKVEGDRKYTVTRAELAERLEAQEKRSRYRHQMEWLEKLRTLRKDMVVATADQEAQAVALYRARRQESLREARQLLAEVRFRVEEGDAGRDGRSSTGGEFEDA